MWKASNTETVNATAEAIWQKWVEVDKWPEQDASLISASINGPFTVGSTITLKPKGSPKVKVVLTQITPLQSFASKGKLPLAKLKFEHQIEPVGDQFSFTQSVTMTGPLSGLFSVLMGKKMEQNLKARMTRMAELVSGS